MFVALMFNFPPLLSFRGFLINVVIVCVDQNIVEPMIYIYIYLYGPVSRVPTPHGMGGV